MVNDIRGRLPHYASDWKDSVNYRVIPSVIYVYFTNLLPAIAFAQDMFDKTNNAYGVNEVLLASALAGIVFGLFSGQPLCIVGVTGPISIFNYTVYDIIANRGTPYFPFMAWICLWSMVMHFVIAVFNWVNSLRYVSRFSCDIFGCFICIIYIQKGIQILTRQFGEGLEGEVRGYLSVVVALLTMIFGIVANLLGKRSKLFWSWFRKLFADYGTPLTVVFFSGFIHFGHRMASANLERLPTTKSFAPTAGSDHDRTHGWFIHFWDIDVSDIFLAIPFALLLTILFYFDHNVSSLICQGSEFPLKKPSSFHWDFFLLGITTGVAGILGIPAPNGLIPQAPLHTQSLCVTRTNGGSSDEKRPEEYVDSVVEQRFTNTVQGLMILGTMSGPLLIMLGLVPQAVLAGLFWIMGITGLIGNGVIDKIWFIFTDERYVDANHPLMKCRKPYLYFFTFMLALGAGAEVGITQTIAAVGFPAVLVLFGVIGYFLPKIIPEPEMSILDEPTASDFILQNLQSDSATIVNEENYAN
ncbi:boron transporter 1 [Trichomonascus vanleenenianus]|uniref:Bor1p n=1 Tax=Trichomonascus vanleenenianus TaxID=2268995 RepID=UPI003ECAF899